MERSDDILTIDPVAMNIVNRVAPGTEILGRVDFHGGVLVQGRLGGDIYVRGPVIVLGDGMLTGRLRVEGDLYVFGRVGETAAAPDDTLLECHGTLYVASTGVTTGTLTAYHLILYEGADIRGPFTTARRNEPPKQGLTLGEPPAHRPVKIRNA
ncbi:MAG TPA: polymer-forming cytoskeletal protein [Ramlibacter sp.]|uniref:bactofilin family protein n=1 Tax=Ramlibacter sp. TaxID=1917967 RepID=UPI002C673A1C|nr:polymer-forming cytoskeletal protein [Ramlibacter sp.]HVZ44643.1 polymer-forming cytoskeletal protein [Ramlibacter sp.]